MIFKKFIEKYPLLDSIIVAIAIIMLWRGVWGLMDLYLFPNQPWLSYTIGGVIGLLLLFLDDFKLTEIGRHEK